MPEPGGRVLHSDLATREAESNLGTIVTRNLFQVGHLWCVRGLPLPHRDSRIHPRLQQTLKLLKQARIERAKGFVAVVGTDAENLYIVLTARGLRSDSKIIARAREEEATSKLFRAGASQVLSPYSFVGSRIAQLLQPNVLDFIDAAFGTERLDVEISEVRVEESSPLEGKSLGDSLFRQQAGVVVLVQERLGARCCSILLRKRLSALATV